MSRPARRLMGILACLLAAPVATGSEYDPWLRNMLAPGDGPRVVLLIDTSIAADSPLEARPDPYESSNPVPGSCDESSIYVMAHDERGDAPPDCASALRLPRSAWECARGAQALDGSPGYWSGRVLGFDPATDLWRALRPGTTRLHCHNDLAAVDPQRAWAAAPAYSLFDGRWLNWVHRPVSPVSRGGVEVLREVLSRWLDSAPGLQVGLVQTAGLGTRLVHPVAALPEAEESFRRGLQNLRAQGSPDWPAAASAVREALGAHSAADNRCLVDQVIVISARAPDLDAAAFGTAQVHAIALGGDGNLHHSLMPLAQRSSGLALEARDEASLELALQAVSRQVWLRAPAQVRPQGSPGGSVSFAGRDHYITTFEPRASARWRGNLRKFRLSSGAVVDAGNRPVTDPDTGEWRNDSRSLWSTTPDGSTPVGGGAAHRLPAPDERNLYTWLEGSGATSELAHPRNRIERSNARLALEHFGERGTAAQRDAIIDWMRGVDIEDSDADGNRVESRVDLGSFVRARPAIVRYDAPEGAPGMGEVLVFAGSDDGFLHAFDARSGQERWAFIAPDFLPLMPRLMRDRAVPTHTPALDGDLRILRFDANADGRIDAAVGDRVWLYAGARGAPLYLALDITLPDRPRLLWQAGPGQLPGLAKAWSTPILTRLRIAGSAQNPEHLVLIVGGGYPDEHDWGDRSVDARGHRLYILDAASGALLWFAGGPGEGPEPDLALADMTSGIPSPVAVVDLEGDEYADRLYVGDLGGRVWRFDFFQGRARSSLASGGVLASLGQGGHRPILPGAHRQFFEAPDVALFAGRGRRPFLHIGLGSGSRVHPLRTDVDDRYYALRDDDPFRSRNQAGHDLRVPLRDSDLPDRSSPDASPPADMHFGWKFALGGTSSHGEKILARPITVNGVALFTSWEPGRAEAPASCTPPAGVNRLHALDVQSAAPAVDLNDDGAIDALDISFDLDDEDIAQDVQYVWESPSAGDEDPGASEPVGGGDDLPGSLDSLGRRAYCMVGVQILRRCIPPQSVLRTYWQREGVDGRLDEP